MSSLMVTHFRDTFQCVSVCLSAVLVKGWYRTLSPLMRCINLVGKILGCDWRAGNAELHSGCECHGDLNDVLSSWIDLYWSSDVWLEYDRLHALSAFYDDLVSQNQWWDKNNVYLWHINKWMRILLV